MRFFIKLYKIYKNSLPQRFFPTLLQNLLIYTNPSASTGLRTLQNLQNLQFFANFTIFCDICDFLHCFVMLIPLTSAGTQILQLLRIFVNFYKIYKNSLPQRFSPHCCEIYNFMLIHQQAPACGFYKIYKICDFSLTSRFFVNSLQNLQLFTLLCNANSTY